MPNGQLEVTFEANVPVVGQILILEAVDFLYSLAALQESGLSQAASQFPNWTQFIATAPGKLLAPEHLLRVRSAHASRVTEVLEGLNKGVEFIRKLISLFKQLNQQKAQHQKLNTVRTELLPLISELKKQGASEHQIQAMVAKATTYTDDVLTELMRQDKLAVK